MTKHHHGKTGEAEKGLKKEDTETKADKEEKAQTSPKEEPTATEKAEKSTPSEEVEKLRDQMLRAMAEAENTRRRLGKELEDTRKYAVSNFAKEMLVVADNFRRALEAVPKDHPENEILNKLIEGVEATERQLLASFERFGIKKINPIGQPFDPNFHRVMMEVEDTDHPAGTIVQVIQEGYMIHDRLLREAIVAVAKGGPQAGKVDTSV